VNSRVCFNYLESVRNIFLAKFGKAKARVANPHAMSNSFGKELESMMHRWNTAPPEINNAGIARVEGNIKDLKRVVHHNIQELINRGDKIEVLVHKSNDLEQGASVFKKRSEMVAKKMRDQNRFYW
jgi:hypothetical protein